MGASRMRAVAGRAAVAVAMAGVVLVGGPLGRGGATSVFPILDLYEQGLTLATDGVGLRSLGAGTATLNVDVGGPVRFAYLYWGGLQEPCDDDPCTRVGEPYRDQQVVFAGTPVQGRIIGYEAQPDNGAGSDALHIGYWADVAGLVAAAGVGTHAFTFADGNLASDLTALDGAALVVGYTDPAESRVFRVLVNEGADFLYGDDPTPGGTRGASETTLVNGLNPAGQVGELTVIAGGGGDGADRLWVGGSGPVDGTLDGDDGDAFDVDVYEVPIRAGQEVTFVNLESPTSGDALRWYAAILRAEVDAPGCSVARAAGPPAHATNRVQAWSGLDEIVVIRSENANTVVPPYPEGTYDPVAITSTLVDQTEIGVVEVRLTDRRGHQRTCEYQVRNQLPTATDDVVVVPQGDVVEIDVLANDTDSDSVDLLTVSIVSPPTSGTAQVLLGRGIQFTADPGFARTDQLTYQVNDGAGGTATAVVQLDITGPTSPPPPAPAPQPACPSDIERGVFPDVDPADVHVENIDCAAHLGIVQGDDAGRFRPGDPVTRGQAATIVRNVLTVAGTPLPAGPDAFTDDDGDVHEANLDALAAAGLIAGFGDGTVRPSEPVTRGQLATIVRNAIELHTGEAMPAGPDAFGDDDTSVHEPAIDALAAAGIIAGTSPTTFAPDVEVSRAQTATILIGAVELAF